MKRSAMPKTNLPDRNLDQGFTIIELSIAMLGASLVMLMIVGMMSTILRVDNDTTNEKEVLDNLRFTRLLLEREIREADAVFADSNDVRLHIWSDLNADNALDANENITWTVAYESGGALRLVRNDKAGNTVTDDSLLILPSDGSPIFAYDVPPPDSARVTLTLESQFRLGNSDAGRSLVTQVSLRNAKNAGGTGP